MNGKIIIAGTVGFLAVAFAAFGAHGLPPSLSPAQRGAFDTAVQLHLIHATFLAALSLAPSRRGLHLCFLLTVVGATLFCGALYIFALTGAHAAALFAPAGGLCLMAGWIVFAAAGLGARRDKR